MQRRTLLPGLLAGLVLLPAAAAVPAVGPGVQEVERPDAGLKRILHLRGGTTLRAVARRVDGAWEYRQNGAYRPLPPGVVVGCELEKDVLARWRERRGEVDGQDLHGRALLAAWALEQGLLEEGVEELEQVLAEDPDQLAARAAASAHAARFRIPVPPADGSREGWEALLAWGGERGRVFREMLVDQLGRVPEEERPGLGERLEAELLAPDEGRRALAALALRRLRPGEAVRPLLVRTVLDRSPSVRREATLALCAVGDESVAAPLVRALDSEHPEVRMHAAEALGYLGTHAAVAPLMARLAAVQSGSSAPRIPRSNLFVGRQFAYLQDFDVEVSSFQSIADPTVNVLLEGAVLDAGVVSVERVVTVREGRVLRQALGRLTGADPGPRNRDWLRWWEEREGAR